MPGRAKLWFKQFLADLPSLMRPLDRVTEMNNSHVWMLDGWMLWKCFMFLNVPWKLNDFTDKCLHMQCIVFFFFLNTYFLYSIYHLIFPTIAPFLWIDRCFFFFLSQINHEEQKENIFFESPRHPVFPFTHFNILSYYMCNKRSAFAHLFSSCSCVNNDKKKQKKKTPQCALASLPHEKWLIPWFVGSRTRGNGM